MTWQQWLGGGGGPARSGMEPGNAMCDHSWLFTSSAWSLVKHPIVGTEPRQGQWSVMSGGHQCSEITLTGETWFHCEFVYLRDANRWPPRREVNNGPVRLCSGVKLQGLHTLVLFINRPHLSSCFIYYIFFEICFKFSELFKFVIRPALWAIAGNQIFLKIPQI